MKIAILGNMNNVGFVLLRHLRDLGVDAHLLLYKDDGVGHSSHFLLESDSWEVERWQKYVHHLPVSNSYGTALSKFLIARIILQLAYFLRKILRSDNAHLTKPASIEEISDLKKILSNYDKFIGSGGSPAIFESIHLNLNIFFPYAIGIENYNERFFFSLTKSINPFVRYIAIKMRKLQGDGILNSRKKINSDISQTKEAYDELGVDPVYNYPPHLYNEKPDSSLYSESLRDAIKEISKYEYKLISHSRHQWVKPYELTSEEFFHISKNTNFLIEGFAKFLKTAKKETILVFFEYGEDYLSSKSLIKKLGIEKYIYWLPIMKRKDILEIIKVCDVGIGEFYNDNVLMGSTGYEILSQEKPLIQGPLDSTEFTKISNIPRPPGLFVLHSDQVKDALLSLEDKSLRKKLGKEGFDWVQEYSGFSNSRKLLQLLDSE